jgi:tRNA (guanine-N7-)-methyltransferase
VIVKAEAENSSADTKQHSTAHATDYEIKIREGEDAFAWNQLFGNSCPVEIEIGCGRGMFIIKRALENPGINFLGIEKSARFFRLLAERVAKSGAKNIRLIRGEASYLLKKFVRKN